MLLVVALAATSCVNDGTWTLRAPADTTHNTPIFNRQLLSVSCPTTTFCMAVGAGGFSATDTDQDVAIVQTWNGTTWTDLSWPLDGPDGSNPMRVECTSATSCFVHFGYWGNADHRDRLAHWDGTTFTTVGVDLQYWPNSLACAKPDFCLITSGGGSATWTNGTLADAAGPSEPDTSACLSSTWCMTVDDFDQTSRIFQGGTSWSTPVAVPAGAGGLGSYWSSVDCTSTTDCIMVGTGAPGATPVAAHWNGIGWTLTTLPISVGRVRTVSCAPTHNCVAVGDVAGTSISLSWNGNNWNVAPAPPGTYPGSYAGIDCLDHWCMGVGYRTGGSPELTAGTYAWTR